MRALLALEKGVMATRRYDSPVEVEEDDFGTSGELLVAAPLGHRRVGTRTRRQQLGRNPRSGPQLCSHDVLPCLREWIVATSVRLSRAYFFDLIGLLALLCYVACEKRTTATWDTRAQVLPDLAICQRCEPAEVPEKQKC